MKTNFSSSVNFKALQSLCQVYAIGILPFPNQSYSVNLEEREQKTYMDNLNLSQNVERVTDKFYAKVEEVGMIVPYS